VKAKSDFIFLGILGALIANTIIQSVLFGYQLSINNYLGFVSWSVVWFLRITHIRFGKYGTALLLIAGSFNVINFGIGRISLSFSIGNVSNLSAETIGLNPIILLILIAYYLVNKNSINRIVVNIFYGSAEEQQKKHQEKVNFYLKKFEGCNPVELEKVFDSINDYPQEAQIALNQIRALKENV